MTVNVSIKGKDIEIELTQQQLDFVNEQFNPKFWEPRERETAFYIEVYNDIIEKSIDWGMPSDQGLFKYGLVFKTSDEAQKAADIMKAKHRLKKAIFELNDGWVPDFTDTTTAKCYIYLCLLNKISITSRYALQHIPSWFYLKSEMLCKELIKTHKEDLLLVLRE